MSVYFHVTATTRATSKGHHELLQHHHLRAATKELKSKIPLERAYSYTLIEVDRSHGMIRMQTGDYPDVLHRICPMNRTSSNKQLWIL